MTLVTLDKQKTNKYRSMIPFIESEFPEHVRLLGGGVDVDPATKQSLLIEFIRRYYDWLETTGQSQNRFNNMELLFDVNYGMDVFFLQYKKQFLSSLPGDFAESSSRPNYTKSFVMKNARNIYRSKGTIPSIEFLFRFLFQDEAVARYPADRYLELEKQKQNQFRYDGSAFYDGSHFYRNTAVDPYIRGIESSVTVGDVDDLPTRKIVGLTTGTTAIVESISYGSDAGTAYFEIKLSSLSGNFSIDEQIRTVAVPGKSDIQFQVTGVILAAIVIDGGTGYSIGDLIQINSDVDLPPFQVNTNVLAG